MKLRIKILRKYLVQIKQNRILSDHFYQNLTVYLLVLPQLSNRLAFVAIVQVYEPHFLHEHLMVYGVGGGNTFPNSEINSRFILTDHPP